MRLPGTRSTLIVVAVLCTSGLATAATAEAASTPVLKKDSIQITAPRSVTAKTKDKLTIGGVVLAGKTHLAGRTVTLQERASAKAAWTSLGHKVSAAGRGTVSFTVTQKAASEQYRLLLAAGKGYARATSLTVTVKRA